MSQQNVKIRTQDNLELAAILETPTGPPPYPLAVLVHGYNSGKDSLTNLDMAPKLLNAGIASVRFDFRGHQESQGKIEDVDITSGLQDLSAIMGWVYQNTDIDQERIGLMGGSYGGVVVTLYAAEHPARARCLVLKAPATDWGEARTLRMNQQEIADWKRIGYHQLEKERPIKVPYSFYEDITSYNTYAAALNITCPVLIVHGDADRSVPVEQSRKLAKQLGGEVKLHVFPGADHRFTAESDFHLMVSESVDFLATHLTS